jgi:hypothetical protein
MMTMSNESITSRTPEQERQVIRLLEDVAKAAIELALKKVNPDNQSLQRLLEHGDEVKSEVTDLAVALTKKYATENTFANEETSSSYTYPVGYKGPKPIEQQIKSIAKIFKLDPAKALTFAKTLPELPNGAEGWFAIPSFSALSKQQSQAVEDRDEQYSLASQQVCKVRSEQANRDSFYNHLEGKLSPMYLRMHPKTADAYDKLIEDQDNSDILIIAAQLGMKHRGKSVRRAIITFQSNEFGLDIVAAMAINLTHPTRFVRYDELDIDLPGNQYRSVADGVFVHAPLLFFSDGMLKLDASRVEDDNGCYGAASGFLPQ